MKPKKPFFEFCNDIRNYNIYFQKTGTQIFKYELYWAGYDFNSILANYIFKYIER